MALYLKIIVGVLWLQERTKIILKNTENEIILNNILNRSPGNKIIYQNILNRSTEKKLQTFQSSCPEISGSHERRNDWPKKK